MDYITRMNKLQAIQQLIEKTLNCWKSEVVLLVSGLSDEIIKIIWNELKDKVLHQFVIQIFCFLSSTFHFYFYLRNSVRSSNQCHTILTWLDELKHFNLSGVMLAVFDRPLYSNYFLCLRVLSFANSPKRTTSHLFNNKILW